jgi:hypothetical protein
MSLTGYNFDLAEIKTKQLAEIYKFLSHHEDAVISGCEVTFSGLNATLGAGLILGQGRLIEIKDDGSLPVVTISQNFSGYLVLHLDIGAVNSSSGTPGNYDYAFTINQISFQAVTTLSTDDINSTGTVYDINLGSITSDSSSVTYTAGDCYNPDFVLTGQVLKIGNLLISNTGLGSTDPITITGDVIDFLTGAASTNAIEINNGNLIFGDTTGLEINELNDNITSNITSSSNYFSAGTVNLKRLLNYIDIFISGTISGTISAGTSETLGTFSIDSSFATLLTEETPLIIPALIYDTAGGATSSSCMCTITMTINSNVATLTIYYHEGGTFSGGTYILRGTTNYLAQG